MSVLIYNRRLRCWDFEGRKIAAPDEGHLWPLAYAALFGREPIEVTPDQLAWLLQGQEAGRFALLRANSRRVLERRAEARVHAPSPSGDDEDPLAAASRESEREHLEAVSEEAAGWRHFLPPSEDSDG